jgi:hypothetical protein
MPYVFTTFNLSYICINGQHKGIIYGHLLCKKIVNFRFCYKVLYNMLAAMFNESCVVFMTSLPTITIKGLLRSEP